MTDQPDYGPSPVKSVLDSLIRDAMRYRKLRDSHWSDDDEDAIVVTRICNTPLGSITYSGERLDQLVDQMEQPQ